MVLFIFVSNANSPSYSEGINIAQIRYVPQPMPGIITASIRIMTGSMFMYSPSPPQTPARMRLLRERYRRLCPIVFLLSLFAKFVLFSIYTVPDISNQVLILYCVNTPIKPLLCRTRIYTQETYSKRQYCNHLCSE